MQTESTDVTMNVLHEVWWKNEGRDWSVGSNSIVLSVRQEVRWKNEWRDWSIVSNSIVLPDVC